MAKKLDSATEEQQTVEGNQQSAPAAKSERKVTPMDMPRFKGSEYERAEYVCTAHDHTTPQDLLEPGYWAHVSTLLKPRARVEAWANDGTWMAEYVTLEAGRNWARLHLLQVYHFTSGDMAMTQADAMTPYEITFRGPHSKWSVIRKSDRAVLHDGSDTARQATEWLTERMAAGI